MEGKNIVIPRHVYEERYARFKKRIDAVIDYITDTSNCRTALLLQYFGEKVAEGCGNCDNCNAANPEPTTEDVYGCILADLRAQLHEGPKYGYELNLSKYKAQDIEHVIRTMTEDGELLQDGLRLKLRG